jgi:AraC-like DNA-binding protein
MRGNFPKIYLYERIVKAKLFIDSNFGQSIDLGNISGEAHFSKFHFLRLFKRIYGRTPYQYLTYVRIEHAKARLEKGDSVAEACFAAGFDSISSFTGLFRRYVKMTPSCFRRKFLERQEQIRKAPLQFIPGCFAGQKGWSKKSNFEEMI